MERFIGIITGVICFIVIGMFHPIVIKCEYYFSKKIWPLFLIVGIFFMVVSCFVSNTLLAAILGVIGCSSLWSIGELFEQEQRVLKGWFPKNPKRTDYSNTNNDSHS